MDRPVPDPNISHYGADAAGNYANLPKATLEMAIMIEPKLEVPADCAIWPKKPSIRQRRRLACSSMPPANP
jgi:hypothetical protein